MALEQQSLLEATYGVSSWLMHATVIEKRGRLMSLQPIWWLNTWFVNRKWACKLAIQSAHQSTHPLLTTIYNLVSLCYSGAKAMTGTRKDQLYKYAVQCYGSSLASMPQ